MGTQANPYVGPRAFTAGERLFARDRELADLVDLVIAERVVLLHSPSGAGKSSLLHAGLVPRLRAEGLSVLPVARVGLPPPIDCPDRFALSVLLGLEEDVPKDRQTPLPALARTTLADYLDRRRGDRDSEVLILDQFEELLTIDPADRPAKLAFLRQLGAALRRPDRYAVLALREDWLAALQAYRDLLPTRLRAGYRLDLLGPAAALAAIQGPAADLGVRFTDAAAGKLVDDLRQVRVAQPDGGVLLQPGPSVEPVQLQVTCRTLWSRLSPGTAAIDVADLAAIGDVDQALAAYCDDELAAVARDCEVPERLVRAWLARNLVTDRGLRTQVLRGQTSTEGLDDRVLAALVDTHLVRADERRGMAWVELAHDRLVAPLLASNARHAERHLGPLERQAELWDSQGRPESLLLAEPALLDRADAEAGARTPAELAFLAACQQLRRRRERARRSARAIAILGALALVGLVVAVVFAVRARRSADAADLARAAADLARGQAEHARGEAEAARQVALARQLGAQAVTLPLVDYELAALLAVEASARAPIDEARGPLLGLEARWPRLQDVLVSRDDYPDSLAVDPQDGNVLVALADRGLLRYGTGRTAQTWTRDLTRSPAFATRGRLFATLGDAGRVLLRDRGDGSLVRSLGDPFLSRDETSALALSPDGATVIAASSTGLLAAFATDTTHDRWRWQGRPGPLALFTNADAVVVVDPTGLVRRDLVDGRPTAELDTPVAKVAGWPGQSIVVVLPPAHDAGNAMVSAAPALVDMRSATLHPPLSEREATYTAIALHPTRTDVAASVCEGECRQVTLRVWDGPTRQLRLVTSLGDLRPELMSYDPGGDSLVVGAFSRLQRFDVRPDLTLDIATTSAVFPAPGRLVTGHGGGISQWTLEPLRRESTIPLDSIPYDLRLDPEARRAHLVTGEGRTLGFDLTTRARLLDTPAPLPVFQATLGQLRDGRLAVAGITDARELIAWDASTAAILGRVPLADDPAGTSWPEWSSDGRVYTSSCARRSLDCDDWRLWRWDPLRPDLPPERPAPALTGLVDDFDTSPDGAALVVSAGGNLVRWALPDLRLRTIQRSDAAWGGSVAHGRSGRWLAAAGMCTGIGCPGPILQLLAAENLQPIGAPMTVHDGAELRVLAAGHDHVITRSDLATRLWDLRLVHLQRRACQLAGRELGPDEWARHLGDLPYRALCRELAQAAP